jgi:hypothetical protein
MSRSGRALLQSFGILLGHNRVVIYVEPDLNGSKSITTDTARIHILLDGQSFPWEDFATEFGSKLSDVSHGNLTPTDAPVARAAGTGELNVPSIEVRGGNLEQGTMRYRTSPDAGDLSLQGGAPGVTVAFPITQQTVTRVIANKDALALQARGLISLLDAADQEAAAGSNAPSLTLWEPGKDGDEELKKLLRELRDELRRFTEALESAPNEVTTESLSSLRKIGLAFAVGFAGAVGAWMGNATMALLWDILASLGVDWNTFKECLQGNPGLSL